MPEEDTRLPFAARFGWYLMNRNVWPEDSLCNAFYAYFIARRRESCIDVLLPMLPLFALTVVNVGAIIVFPEPAFVFAMLTAEVFFLPLLAGLFAIFLVSREHRFVLSGVNMEEILLTRLEAQEIVYSLAARPISRVGFSLFLHLFSIIIATASVLTLYGAEVLLVPIFALFSTFVWYTTRGFVDWGTMNANRVYFLSEDGVPKGFRAVKDFLWQRGIAYFAASMVITPLLYLAAAISECLLLLFVIGIPFGLTALSGMASEEAARMAQRTILLLENNRSATLAAACAAPVL